VPVPGGRLKAEVLLRGELPFHRPDQADGEEDRPDYDVEAVEAGRHEEGRTVDRPGKGKRRVGVFVELDVGEDDAEDDGECQPPDEALAVVVQQGMVRPGDRRARQEQGDRIEQRQVQRIEHVDADRRPLPTKDFRPQWLNGFAGKQAGVEERPEPGGEEHHFGGDEHDHAVAQMQRHDPRMGALAAFLDGIRPPGEHHVENHG